MLSRGIWFLLLPLCLATPATGGFDTCLAESALAERARCLESYLSGHSPTDLDFQRLQSLVREDPQAADLLLTALGRFEGSSRLTWFGTDGQERWSVAVDPGDHRLERAAEALIAAGRKDEAKRLLERALSLGAGDRALEAWNETGAGPVAGLDPLPSPLLAPPWFPRVPELRVSLMDGEWYELESARGSVLILDFWATWCVPCLEELPKLQQLHDELGEQGLVALTINAGEPEDLARAFARQLGLTLPIGRFDAKLDEAFHVRALPTLILIDREGRIRGRWDGYSSGLEQRVAEHARRLLTGGDPEGEPRAAAEVLTGSGLLRAEWFRGGRFSIEGMVVAPAGESSQRIFVLRKGVLSTFDETGRFLERDRLPSFAGWMGQADLDGDGHAELVSFRPGGRQVIVFDPRRQTHVTWEAPSHVLDLAPWDGGSNDGGSGWIWLATVDGLFKAGPSGEPIQKIEGTGETSAVRITGSGASARILALEAGGTLRTLHPGGRSGESREVPEWTRSVLSTADSGGWGVIPRWVTAAVVGRFLGGSGYQAALATESSQLVLVDLGGGEVRFRARWEGIRHLAAGDLDGDDRDELVVAAGSALYLLSGSDPGNSD